MAHRFGNRRTVLKGLAAGGTSLALGLPFLESQLNSAGTALAQGEALPGLFGVWYAGGGIWPGAFLPVGTGAQWRIQEGDERLDWMRSREPQQFWEAASEFYNYTTEEHGLGLLASPEYRELFSLVSGTKTAQKAQHTSGQTNTLSGAHFVRRASDREWIFEAETCDQTVAKSHGTRPLVMTADPVIAGYEAHNHISWRKDGNREAVRVVDYTDSVQAFADLFGEATSDNAAELERARLARRSVLDYLRPQLQQVQLRVSTPDQARIDQHLTALREVESDLEATTSRCSPEAPVVADEHIERHQQMARVVTLALSCGVRSVFTLQCTRCQSELPLAGSGGVANHPLQHRGFLGDGNHDLDLVRAAIRNQSEQGRRLRLTHMAPQRRAVRTQLNLYADLIKQMNETPYGAGSLLDSSAVVGTFEMWDGNYHGFDEHPMLIAGNAHGRLRTGHHLRVNGHPAEVCISAMRAVVENPEEMRLAEIQSGISEMEI